MNKKVPIGTCTTNGGGYWTTFVIATNIIGIEVIKYSISKGELRAYFDVDQWSTYKNGLIYTDPQWIKDFESLLYKLGVTKKALRYISYSEQGMQGDNYVSMDISDDFVTQLDPLLRFTLNLPQLQHIYVLEAGTDWI